jgi:hypothetical protein
MNGLLIALARLFLTDFTGVHRFLIYLADNWNRKAPKDAGL